MLEGTNDRPRWAGHLLDMYEPATDEQLSGAARTTWSDPVHKAVLRRLADTEVELAHAKARLVRFKAQVILNA